MESISRTEPLNPPIRLLLIDKDQETVNRVKSLLGHPDLVLEYELTTVHSVACAIDTLRSLSIDLILLGPRPADLTEPSRAFYRLNETSPQIPIILLGTFTERELALLKHGLQEVIHFPSVVPQQFATIIRKSVLRNSHLISIQSNATKLVRARTEFLAKMSHEIRTLLTGVVGLTCLLKSTELNQEQDDFVFAIQNTGESLLNIVSELLDCAKLDAGKLQLRSEPFNIRELVEDTITLFAPLISQRDIVFTDIVDPKIPPKAVGDSSRIRQVLANLISNAIKFTHVGEIILRVTLLETRENSLILRFEISDTGPGIPDTSRSTLFEMFSETTMGINSVAPGSGLGLAISKSLVELMGGTMGVQSEIGYGTTFWFQMSLSKSPESGIRKARPTLAGARILLVTEGRMSATRLVEQMELRGLSTEITKEIDPRKLSRYDLVLIDYHLNEASLNEYVKLIRGISKDIPVLILSNVRSKKTKLKNCRQLRKPYKQSELYEAIANLLTGDTGSRSLRSPRVQKETPFQKTRVLLVEDNSINQLVISRMLGLIGVEAKIANSGMEALDYIRREIYQAILMDCRLPGIDGFETTEKIREWEMGQSRTPIIAITAGEFEENHSRCLAAGMDDFITKPLRIELLEKKLKHWIPVFSIPGGSEDKLKKENLILDGKHLPATENIG